MMHPLSEKVKKNLLPFVMKPGRYVGNELGAVRKDHQGRLRVALAFPDLYEIGMSYLGSAILYHIINRRADCVAERVFAPWPDAEEISRRENIPLFSLESHTPLQEFDIIGFSLTYELNYANILNMLDLAGIPIWSAKRDESHPLIIAGGPSAMNPEPMAEFFDLFALGDAEEMIGEIIDVMHQERENQAGKEELLLRLSQIPGVYVPQFYEVKYSDESRFESIRPKAPGVPETIEARIVPQLKNEYYPPAPIVPFLETTHDRLTIEIMRGCPMRCRFCAATVAYQPKRERPVDDIVSQADAGIVSSGWDEISLLSLSTTDYSQLPLLARTLHQRFSSRKVSISLPSLRPDSLTLEVAQLLARVKKPGLTFAPEAGTARLRNVIGKHLQEDDLLNTARIAFSSGWNLLKLYFMIGLPTEGEEDLQGIVNLLKKILRVGKEGGQGKNLNVTISPFTPKPHTPFQWERLRDIDSLQEKIYYLRSNLRPGNLHLKFRDPHVSYLEGILGRGDRRLSAVIFSAWKRGARLDGWTEHFNYQLWKEGFVEAGIDPAFYAQEMDASLPLPWDHIHKGSEKDHLKKERNRAYALAAKSAIDQECARPSGSRSDASPEGVKISDLVSEERLQEAVSSTEESPLTVFTSYGRKKKKKPLSLAVTVARGRVRIRWSKSEEVRFTSHLDIGRTFERTIRRSGIPIAYSEGFHPHQKVAFGPPLPLGFISDSEYLDIQLTEPYTSTIIERLNRALPAGFEFLEARSILGKSDSLSYIINLASYEVNLNLPPEQTESSAQSVLESDHLGVKRISKEEVKELDIRRYVVGLSCESSENQTVLKMLLAVGSEGYARPQEVLTYGFGLEEKKVLSLVFKRTGLFITKDRRILTPMEVV
ncbi:MAG: TIGR03960 family B12-binding radical SAM protein [Candidatus Zixiibacteriota bacterium]